MQNPMANGKQIGKRINYLSVETLPDCRVIGHIFSYRSQYPSRTDQYVVLTAARLGQQSDNTHPRWQLCAMGPVGHLKGHHAYAYLGLQAPHGQIQLDTTNLILCTQTESWDPKSGSERCVTLPMVSVGQVSQYLF